jgi:hypothetical protein
MNTLLGLAFDFSWEMRLDESEEGQVEIVQDVSVHRGFRPGEFPRRLTAHEWIQRMHPDNIRD